MTAYNPCFHLRSLSILAVLPFAIPLAASLVVSALALLVVGVLLLQEPPRRDQLHKKKPGLDKDVSLASEDETEVLSAIDELAAKGGSIPSLVLYHPNPKVVTRALSVIGSQRDLHLVLPHLMQHQDASVRQAAQAFAH